MTQAPLPPNQQWAAPGRWPVVGERTPRADAAPWSLTVTGLVERPAIYSLEELRELGRVERTLDIHCVTRWSQRAMHFAGASLECVLQLARPLPEARYIAYVARSERSHSTSLPLGEALELGTLLALEAEGQPLSSEHGGPLRVITPGRYFYKSLKWLERVELLAEDRLGYWEAEAGYHNHADPAREERYMAPRLSRAEMAAVLATRDFRNRDLRSLAAAGHDLTGLRADRALLRDADFRGAQLQHARFDGANLSNAHFERADLRGASMMGADCEGADFSGADLRGADFSGASLFGATFCRINSLGECSDPARFGHESRLDPAALEQLTAEQARFTRVALGWKD